MNQYTVEYNLRIPLCCELNFLCIKVERGRQTLYSLRILGVYIFAL